VGSPARNHRSGQRSLDRIDGSQEPTIKVLVVELLAEGFADFIPFLDVDQTSIAFAHQDMGDHAVALGDQDVNALISNHFIALDSQGVNRLSARLGWRIRIHIRDCVERLNHDGNVRGPLDSVDLGLGFPNHVRTEHPGFVTYGRRLCRHTGKEHGQGDW
jgi:hypothetical protein